MSTLRVLRGAYASVVVLALLAPARSALADGRLAPPPNSTWTRECGACHLPYPPRLLPARSWRAIMAGLDQHFGADASLDARTATEVTAFLQQYAGRDRGVTATHRITDTAWFGRKHREVPAAVWTRADVRGRANCAACHRGADRGDYDEHTVRLPQ